MKTLSVIITALFGWYVGVHIGKSVMRSWDRPAFSWERPKAEETTKRRKLPRHTLRIGAPRSGKSVATITEIVEIGQRILSGDPTASAVVVGDPNRTTGDAAIEQFVGRGMEDLLVVDDLSKRDRVLMHEVLERSTNPDPIRRRDENELALQSFLSLLIRSGSEDQIGRLQGKYAAIAAKAWIYQKEETWGQINLKWLPFALMPRTEEFVYLWRNCTDAKTRHEMERLWAHRSVPSVTNDLEPAKRLIDPLFESTAFEARISKPGMDLKSLLLQKKVIIVYGGGETPHWVRLMLIGSIFQRVHRIAEQHFGMTGQTVPVKVFREECNAFKFVQMPDLAKFAECLKTGVEETCIYQHLNLREPELRDAQLDVVGRIEVFRQNANGAAIMAREFGPHLFDHKKVKHEELRERNLLRGYTDRKVVTTGESEDSEGRTRKDKRTSIQRDPISEIVTDRNLTYEALNEQDMLLARTFMEEPPGHRMVKEVTSGVVEITKEPEYVVLLESPWAYPETAKREVQAALSRLLSSPLYQEPDWSQPKVPETEEQPKKSAAATRKARSGTKKSSGGSCSGQGQSKQ